MTSCGRTCRGVNSNDVGRDHVALARLAVRIRAGRLPAIRVSLKWRSVYDETRKRPGNRKAIVAVARRLLAVLHALLRTGQSYRYGVQERSRAPQEAAATP